MERRSQLFSLIVILVLCFCTGGCATGKAMSWIEKGCSIASFKSIEILPVTNDTGRNYDFDVADDLTKRIKDKISGKPYQISEDPSALESVMLLKTSLIAYEPGSALKRWVYKGYGATVCNVRCAFIDKKTEKVIGEIVVSKSISEGGLYSIGAHTRILSNVAEDIADEIEKRRGEK